MNAPVWVSTFLDLLGRHALLGRLFFASVEFGALALVVGLLIHLFRVRQPRLRALLWLVVLAKPLVGLAVGTPLPLLALRLAAPPQPVMQELNFEVVQGAVPLAPLGLTPAVTVPTPTLAPERVIDWSAVIPRALLGLWLAGVLAFALRLLISEWRIGRIIRQAASPSPWLAGRLAEVVRGMGLGHVPPCRVTPALESPALVGFWRPVILLPEWISAEADQVRVEWSLRHELMHWRLRDPLAALVCELAKILFFFHPAAWWAGRRWQEATEMACDRALIHSLEDAALYAEELYRMLMMIRAQRCIPVAGGLFAGRTQISKRIESLLKNPLRSPAHLSAASLSAVILFSCASMTFGIGSGSRAADRAAVAKTLPSPQAGLLLDAKAIKKDPVKRAQISAKSIKKDNDNTLYLEGDVRYGIDFGPFAAVLAGAAVTVNPENQGFVQLTVGKTPLNEREAQLVALGRAAHSNPLEKVWAAADKVVISFWQKECRFEGNAILVQQKKPDELWVYRSSVILLSPDTAGQPEVGITKAIRGYNGPALTVIKADEIIGKPAAIDLGKGNNLPFDLMRADSFNSNPDGRKTVMSGKARIESKGLMISGDQITLDQKTKVVEIKGKPVKLDLNPEGKGIAARGECGLLTYDLRTSTILMKENPAIIREGKNGEKIRSTAGSIKIEQDGAGQYKISLMMSANGKEPIETTAINAGKGGNGQESVTTIDSATTVTFTPDTRETSATGVHRQPQSRSALKIKGLLLSRQVDPKTGQQVMKLTDPEKNFDVTAAKVTSSPESGKFLLEGGVKLTRGPKLAAQADTMTLEVREGRIVMLLDGHASIIQVNGRKSQALADAITIDFHNGIKEEPGVGLTMRNGGDQEIKIFNDQGKLVSSFGATPASGNAPEQADGNGVKYISSIPVTSDSPRKLITNGMWITTEANDNDAEQMTLGQSYLAVVQDRLESNFKPTADNPDARCTVGLTIARSGSVFKSWVSQSSQNNAFDDRALAAVNSTKLPSFSERMKGDTLTVFFTFHVTPITPSDADKRSAEVHSAKAWRLWGQGKPALAEPEFKAALKLDPDNANTWNGLGWAQFNQGKPLNARESFEHCLKLDPKHAGALNGLGWIAKGEGRTDAALAYWKQAVEVLPGASAALNGLTMTYMELKNYKEAERYYEQWLKAEPNNADAKSGLAKAQAAQRGVPGD